jgi:hypothetical protein
MEIDLMIGNGRDLAWLGCINGCIMGAFGYIFTGSVHSFLQKEQLYSALAIDN